MNFHINEIDGVKIFSFNEPKLDTNCSGLLKAELTNLISNNDIKKLIIDLSQVESCDSSGLSALLVANRLLSSADGNLIFVTQSAKLIQLIKITQLHRVLTLSDTIADAVLKIKNK
ncbi:MAG: STAS domain-containing protein [Ignavibacteriaceae bacterium]